MLSRNFVSKKSSLKALFALSLFFFLAPQASFAQPGYAVVPTGTIYPGEVIGRANVVSVKITNPNLAAGFASDIEQVIGKVTKSTLVAGHTIPLGGLRDPFTVERGAMTQMTFTISGVSISAMGVSLDNAMTGDVVRVRNKDTGVIVSGTVRPDGTIEVMQQ